MAALDAHAGRAVSGRSGAAASLLSLLGLRLRSAGLRARLSRARERQIDIEGKRLGWSRRLRRGHTANCEASEAVLAAVNKTAAFVFYERLFALWHVLHCRCSQSRCLRPCCTWLPFISTDRDAGHPHGTLILLVLLLSATLSMIARAQGIREAGHAGTDDRRARGIGEPARAVMSRSRRKRSPASAGVPQFDRGGSADTRKFHGRHPRPCRASARLRHRTQGA